MRGVCRCSHRRAFTLEISGRSYPQCVAGGDGSLGPPLVRKAHESQVPQARAISTRRLRARPSSVALEPLPGRPKRSHQLTWHVHDHNCSSLYRLPMLAYDESGRSWGGSMRDFWRLCFIASTESHGEVGAWHRTGRGMGRGARSRMLHVHGAAWRSERGGRCRCVEGRREGRCLIGRCGPEAHRLAAAENAEKMVAPAMGKS